MRGENPLHIYRSILGFTPPRSKIQQNYSSKYQNKIPKLLGQFSYSEDQGPYAQFAGHMVFPLLFEISPNGERLVSVEMGVSFMWDTASGARFRPNTPNQNFHGLSLFTQIVFSPDGTLFFTESTDTDNNRIFTWNVETFQLLDKMFVGHTARITSLIISEDGNWLLSGSEDCTVIIWNVQLGRKQGDPLVGHSARVDHLAFSAGNQYIASAASNEIAIWRTFSGTPLQQPLKLQDNAIIAMKFLTHEDHVATCSKDGIFAVMNIKSASVVRISMFTSSSAYGMCIFNPDSTKAACCSTEGEITIINIDDGHTPVIHSILKGNEHVRLLQFLPEPNSLLSLSFTGRLIQWDITSGEALLERGVSQGGKIMNARITRDCKLIAINEVLQGDIMLWKMEDLLDTEGFGLSGRSIECLDLSPSQTTVASGSEDGLVYLWDTRTGEGRAVLGKHEQKVEAVTFSPNGRLVATFGADKVINIWDIDDGTALCSPLRDSDEFLRPLCFSPDGRFLITITRSHKILVWNLSSTPEIRFQFEGHEDTITSIICDIDSQSLFSASHDGILKEWSLTTGEELQSNILEGHIKRPSTIAHYPVDHIYYPTYLAISPDGNRLACISNSFSKCRTDYWDIRPTIVHLRYNKGNEVKSPLVFSKSARYLYGKNWLEVFRVFDSQDLLRNPASRPEDHHPISNLYVESIGRWICKFHPKGEKVLRIKDGFLITSWLCFNNIVVIGASTGSVYMIDCDGIV
jgi:WD40 repeat protein